MSSNNNLNPDITRPRMLFAKYLGMCQDSLSGNETYTSIEDMVLNPDRTVHGTDKMKSSCFYHDDEIMSAKGKQQDAYKCEMIVSTGLVNFVLKKNTSPLQSNDIFQ